MSNEEFNLYNELRSQKNKLQQQNYDYEKGRKPSICSDEVLQLLAKYKPTTLSDMNNISGIGDTFIENYGAEFLTLIKKYKKNDVEEISDNEKTILSKLENRLVNINKRNRLLYSGKVNKDYGIDVLKYLDNYKELEKFIINQESSKFKLLDFKTYDEQKLKTIAKIVRQSEKIEVESGNKELYIAYPFAQGKFENENFYVKAPLMLFPINISKTADSIFITNDTSRDIIYNTTLILANNKFNGKNEVLPDNAVEEYTNDNYIKNMLEFYAKNSLLINNNECEVEKFLETNMSTFPKYRNGEIEIKKYMVMGLYSTYVTSMYEDFHKMIERKDATGLIKDLLWGVENTNSFVDMSYEEKDGTQIEEEKSLEESIHYINELDSSQEKVLEKINKCKSLVVQGPPGTGKSQTITSMVAQAILQGKKVLMVSEKKTALDVIFSRLGHLSNFALLIDDIENKDHFYKQFNSILKILNEESEKLYYSFNEIINNQNKISEKIVEIDTNLQYLEVIGNKVYGINDFGTSMYEIYNSCRRIDINNPTEIEIYKFLELNKNEKIMNLKYPILRNIHLKLKDENLKESIIDYLSIVRYNAPLVNIKNNLTEMELYGFKEDISSLADYILEVKQYNFIKKIFNKNKIDKMITNFINKYFLVNNKTIAEYIVNHTEYLKGFVENYTNFISNKFVYDKLSFEEKDYISWIEKFKDNISLSFEASNEEIYNFILYNAVQNFEKNNPDVLNYINNFDIIRANIRKSIVEKKELTKELAYLVLLENTSKLNGNNKLNKIEEMCNRKRKMSVNKFMDKYKFEIMDSISIWLMTPEVVSDILPFEKKMFDIVIFDEASQLYVEKAIPAIYRAKKVVVAGDQKQLKPSSLGQGRILDEIDEDEISDGFLEYESLLDAANYKFDHTMLNYHYRSRHNELIAFSNYAFYNGKLLVTSNAISDEEKPIERIMVKDGRWIDKKNEKEAEEVVKLVKNILATRKNNETIGVITFNSSQMNLIEDIIDKEMSKDDKFSTLITAEKNRYDNGENIGFFVKNIESVQGDERDIIIFCIGYAKNETGRVAINFGWLNQDGGENRLNVAISRAKNKIYVVTSIEPDDLIVDNTKNNGPKLFKEYLKYVKAVNDGNKELVESILVNLLDKNDTIDEQFSFDSVFEEEVCNKLLEKGYKVKSQYGVGGYRIDLVITSDDGKDNILGIECDGRLYHSSKFARERDYHRQKYLESRGWNIYRIWSINWWKNPQLEIKKIEDYLSKLKNKK